jgi:two-component system OmpR family response regulator
LLRLRSRLRHDGVMAVLVVEDDAKLLRSLVRGLQLEGYSVETVTTGPSALELASTQRYDAVVLDLMLPGLDGLEVCRSLRAADIWTPVLVLTARTQVEDRIRGLDTGADDYLTKPFAFGELLARLRVLVRRGPVRQSPLLAVADLRVDPATRVVTRRGHQVELTAREFDVLVALLRSPGRPLRRHELLQEVWPEDTDVSPNVVDVYIGYLRRKLERPHGPRLIRTIRGKGFMLEAS